jgi:hypothetical protein
MGGNLNMVLHAERDRASPSDQGDIRAQDLLRDFTAQLCIAPPSLDRLEADHAAWPATYHVGQATATRLDYLMLPTAHVSASRGVATWSPGCIDTDHSVIMLTVCRYAALGRLTDASRKHRQQTTRNVTPLLTAKEAGPTWTEECAKLDRKFLRLTAILAEDLRPGQTTVNRTDAVWTSFVAINKGLGRALKPAHFDTRPKKPNWNLKISAESRLHAARCAVMGAYEQAGYRPTPTISCMPQALRLPLDDQPPPSVPTRFQFIRKFDREWKQSYDRLQTTYRAKSTDIRRQRVELCVKRAKAKDTTVKEDRSDNPSKQYGVQNAFRTYKGGASASAGAYGPDPESPDGPPIWHTDPYTVMVIQQTYLADLMQATPWNRAPDDPAATLKAPLSPGLAAHLADRKTMDFEP